MPPGGTRHLTILAAWALVFVAVRAASANEPTTLARMISAAQAHGEGLAPATYGDSTYDLRSAEFVGRCRAAFGTVQVAQFSYVRSGGPDGTPPPRGHHFVLFFDGACRLRNYWRVDLPLDGLRLDGTVLRCREEAIFDFADLSPPDTILVDGRPQDSPALAIGRPRPSRLPRQR